MKRLIILSFMICSFVSMTMAQEKGNQHRLSPSEFREKQQMFITDKANLTKEEAAKFFPLYFQLQDKKKKLNDKAWNLIREGKQDDVTEAQYNEILEEVYDSRIAVAELEKSYYLKFKKILPAKKIFLIQKAEMRFHRELLKGVNNRSGNGNKSSNSTTKKANK